MKELPLILLKENYSKSSPINQNFLEYSMIQLVREREREREIETAHNFISSV